MIRVLMLSKACLVGPYQRKLEEIAKHQDIQLLVITPPSWRDPAGTIEAERTHVRGYELIFDPIRFNGNYHLHYYPKLMQRIREFEPDIVHIDEEPYNLATWLAWRQAKKVGAKTLFFSWQNINRAYPFPFSWMEKQVLDGVDYALMGNRASVRVWREKGYKGPLRLIPQFGVDVDLYHPNREGKNGRILTIGSANRRLVPEKGVDILLKAVAKLDSPWQLLVAGEGSAKAELIELANQLDIATQVKFVGAIGSQQMMPFLQQLDMLVLSSRTLPNWKEQFGRILIEAMATEVVVLGAQSGEIPNVIGHAGFTFQEDNDHALWVHLDRLAKADPLRKRFGALGRQRVIENYTQTAIADKTVKVYRDMMEE